MIRLGVIGCGVIGTKHLEAAARSDRIVIQAVADLVDAKRAVAVEAFKPVAAYVSGSELLRDASVDAVVLAVPTVGRTALALESFAAGKHTLIEKPVAMNAADAQRLIAARGARVAACCSSRFRFSARARRLTDLVASGRLGALRILRSRAIVPAGPAPTSPRPEWRLKRELNGGGILVNWGCYDLDFLLGVCGFALRPVAVFAQTWPVPDVFDAHVPPGSTAEAYYTALIRCEGGAVISLERGEYMAARPEGSWELVGERGAARFSMTDTGNDSLELTVASGTAGALDEATPAHPDAGFDVHAGPVLDFVAAIEERRPPATTLEQALLMQQITDAIYASAETGRSIAL